MLSYQPTSQPDNIHAQLLTNQPSNQPTNQPTPQKQHEPTIQPSISISIVSGLALSKNTTVVSRKLPCGANSWMVGAVPPRSSRFPAVPRSGGRGRFAQIGEVAGSAVSEAWPPGQQVAAVEFTGDGKIQGFHHVSPCFSTKNRVDNG